MNVVEVVSKIAEVIHEMRGPDKPFSESSLISRIFPEKFRFIFAENLEKKFEIELEREEISAWTNLTDVKNSVLNQVTARVETDDERIKKHMPMYGTNIGHGHVWTRPDGSRARCGGPTICPSCARDSAWVEAAKKGEEIPHGIEPGQKAQVAPVSDKFDQIASAIDSGNATKLAELLPSETMVGNFDHSSADVYAMAWHLMNTGSIEAALARHNRSWLMRDKFKNVEYRHKTIDAAVSLARRVTGKPDAQFWNVEDKDETCSASGAGCDMTYMNRFDKFGCRYCGRDATPEEDKAYRELEPVVVAPINRIEHADVENFRLGNYTVRTAFDQYQHIALKSAIYPGKGTPFGLMYVSLGLAEAGETQNKVKKAFRDDGIISFGPLNDEGGGFYANQLVRYGQITPERKDQIVKELRGLLWYMAATAEEIGTTLQQIALGNLEELCGRTDRGTLGGDGDDR